MLGRITLGMFWGAAMALLFSGVATLSYTLGWITESSAEGPAPYMSVVVAYIAGGIPGGAVAGALWPITRRVVGAIVVGIAAMIPVYLAGGTLIAGPPQTWTINDWFIMAILALTFGVIVGIRLWSLRCGMSLDHALTLESLLQDCGCDSSGEPKKRADSQ